MKKLQEVTPYKVMNMKECLDALGWSYTECEERFDDISCDCGGDLEFRGFFGTEVVECQKCGKSMTNLFSPIPIGTGSCTVLSPEDYEYENNRHWIAIDGKGGITACQD